VAALESVAVVGAGAAGLVAAAFSASAGRRVTLIERTKDGGRKILISGGGRCNVLPSVAAPDRFVTDSPPHLLRAMLRAWPLHEQRAFIERDLGIPLKLEEESGKLFPRSDRAADVRDGLVQHARSRGVTLQFNTTVTGLHIAGTGFVLDTSDGPLECGRVVLAAGGLSVPNTGSDGTGLRIAKELGIDLIEPYPALTPLLADGAPQRGALRSSPHGHLSGVSLTVRLRARPDAGDIETHGGFLFTHRGYSGPSVLDISHVTHLRQGFGGQAPEKPTIRVQWCALGEGDWRKAFSEPSVAVVTILSRHLPDRLAAQLMAECGVPADRRTSALKRAERVALSAALTAYPLPWTGNEGYKKAEVTGGGVALSEVEPRTLESRRVPGLFLCGEMLDAFGPIGGHNFSWAWATGRAAGIAAGRR
jgi:predicted Rossmann fold flavoprotein